MKPVIDHLGHACIRYQHQSVVLTMDPWFYPGFLQSWFPYPDNRGLVHTALDSDYIYISHAHEDHFDREFLKQVDPSRTTIIIPKFRSNHLQKELAKIGFTGYFAPIVLKHGENTTLPTGIKLTMLIDRSHKEDSALLVESPDGFRFLNSNDCELAIPDWPTDIDLLACQFSGAFWYPHCYDFSPQAQLAKTQEVVKNNIDRLYRRVRITGAKSYLPSAGPAVFLDPALDSYNVRGGIFPTWPEVAWDFKRQFPQVSIHPYLSNYTNISEYRDERREEWREYYALDETHVTEEELNAHFIQFQKLNKRFLRDWTKDIGISCDNRNWQVRLGLLADSLEESFHPEYFLDVPPRILRAVVDNRITWETALLTMRVKLHRDPDIYDNTLMGLLTFGDRPVQTLTMAKQQASDEMTSKAGYEFQRWCPHAGEDMNYATVADGKITCARHEWCWDANTGECLTGQGVPLKVRKNA